MPVDVVPLTEDHREQAWQLGRLAFGGDPSAPPPVPTRPPRGDSWGVLDARGRLVAKAVLLDLEQWWGGRRVPTGGVAGVAVHPDARGSGTATALLRALSEVMRERGQGLSALFPTVVGLYRHLGWEVVGALDETVLTTRALGDAPASTCTVRTAEPDEAPALAALYTRWAQQQAGPLTREGRVFPDAAAELFESDVVAVAEAPDGAVLACAAYDRGRGYREGAELTVHELVSTDARATSALLGSLGRWHPVASRTRWHGPTDELARLLPVAVPPPSSREPWMLRVVDPVRAVADRGWPTDVEVRLRLHDPEQGDATWQLSVSDGSGVLHPSSGPAPVLHARGLALLLAGAADTAAVTRLGLLDGPLPGLDAALAGPAPVLLDYF